MVLINMETALELTILPCVIMLRQTERESEREREREREVKRIKIMYAVAC